MRTLFSSFLPPSLSLSLSLSIFSSYPFLHHHLLLVLPLFLLLLLKLVKARSGHRIARKKSHHNCSTLIHDVQKRKTERERGCARSHERERKKKKSVSFFASSSNGNALFRVSNFFFFPSLALVLSLLRSPALSSSSLSFFYHYMLVFSLAHSRGFSERDNWVRRNRSFPSNFFFFLPHTYTHTSTSCAKRLIYFVHCLIFSDLQAPGDISFYRRGRAAKRKFVPSFSHRLFFFSLVVE